MTDPAGGMPDMNSLMAQASEMAQRLMEGQAETEALVVEGSAGGGAVKVVVTGGMEFESVSIDPSAVDPDDIGLLEDLVLAALNNAMDELADQTPDAGLGGLDLGGLDLGSLGLPGLGGAPGGDAT